ncbi:MAG: hypothetical protein KDA99_14725 [Planctomycetales bacterium]|nr:hypothetical protein [Planctomycetales bacterium]
MAITLLCFATLVRAERPHDWPYMEGSWRFESSNGYEAEIEYEIVAGGSAAIGRWTDKEGGQTIETIGWRPNDKTMVSIGFGTGGKYWKREYTVVSKDKCTGKILFVDPNGTIINGNSTLTRVGPDLITGELIGKTTDGKEVNMSVKFKRRESTVNLK